MAPSSPVGCEATWPHPQGGHQFRPARRRASLGPPSRRASLGPPSRRASLSALLRTIVGERLALAEEGISRIGVGLRCGVVADQGGQLPGHVVVGRRVVSRRAEVERFRDCGAGRGTGERVLSVPTARSTTPPAGPAGPRRPRPLASSRARASAAAPWGCRARPGAWPRSRSPAGAARRGARRGSRRRCGAGRAAC